MTDLFQHQRDMRNLRQAARQRGVIALLDIGTAKITCLVLKFGGPSEFRDTDDVGPMAGQSAFRVIGQATTQSRGVRYGEIETTSETMLAIRRVANDAQKLAGVRVDHAIVCLSGARPESYGLAGEVVLPKGIVSQQDVVKVLSACDMPPMPNFREAIHAHPVNFSIDHRTGLSDPRHHSGNKLAVDLHLLTVDKGALRNIIYCVEKCDMAVAGLASSAYTSGMSSLVEDEKELGAACIDFGAGTTSVSIFVRKHMIFADSLRMGGALVTSDIAQGLGIPLSQAEAIKCRNGGVESTGRDDHDIIPLNQSTGDWETDNRSVSRSELIAIMRPRVEEILEGVRDILDSAGFGLMPSQQIVLTGGASQIPGLDTLAARMLERNVRMGRPLRITGLPHQFTGPEAASVVGLSLFATNPQDEIWDYATHTNHQSNRPIMRAYRWFRDNW